MGDFVPGAFTLVTEVVIDVANMTNRSSNSGMTQQRKSVTYLGGGAGAHRVGYTRGMTVHLKFTT